MPLPIYLVAGIAEVVSLVRLHCPLPIRLSGPLRVAALFAGSLLYASGMGLALWGRLAFDEKYNFPTSLGAELFADQRPVTARPPRAGPPPDVRQGRPERPWRRTALREFELSTRKMDKTNIALIDLAEECMAACRTEGQTP